MELRAVLTLFLALLCLAPAQALPEYGARPLENHEPEEFGGCSFACAMGWKTRVSGHLAASGQLGYEAANLEDHSVATCWAVKPARGSWLETVFERSDGRQCPAPLRGLRLANGYQKRSDLFQKNARLKTVRLEHNGVAKALLHLLDRQGVQEVSFPELQISPGDAIRLVIVEVYAGSRYPEACLSEFVWDGAH